MPYDKRCAVDAVSNNIRQWYDKEKKMPQDQAVAAALSTLKRACGVTSKERMTPKEIVAQGQKAEGAQIYRAQQHKKKKSFLHTKIGGKVGKAGDAVMRRVYKVAPKLRKKLRGEQTQPVADTMSFLSIYRQGLQTECGQDCACRACAEASGPAKKKIRAKQENAQNAFAHLPPIEQRLLRR